MGLSPNCASGVAAVRLYRPKTGQPSKLRGSGRTVIPRTSVTPTFGCPVSLVYVRWKFSEGCRGVNLVNGTLLLDEYNNIYRCEYSHRVTVRKAAPCAHRSRTVPGTPTALSGRGQRGSWLLAPFYDVQRYIWPYEQTPTIHMRVGEI